MSNRFFSRALALSLGLALLLPAAVMAKGTQGDERGVPTSFATINGNPLRINVGADLSFQIFNTSIPGSLGQIFPNSQSLADMGWMVRIGPTLYGPNFGGRGSATGGLGALTGYGATTQSAVTGSGSEADPFTVVTTASVAGLTLRETATFVNGQNYFFKDFEVLNPGAAVAPATVYLGSDIFLASSDSGKPLRVSNSGATGGRTCPAVTGVYNIVHIPLTPPSRFTADQYAAVWSQIAGGVLPNTVNPADCIDNGAALQWNLNVPAGGSIALRVATSFGDIPVLVDDLDYVPPLMPLQGQYVPPVGAPAVLGAVAADLNGDGTDELVITAGRNSTVGANSLAVIDQDPAGKWYPIQRVFNDSLQVVNLAKPTRSTPRPPIVTLDADRRVRIFEGMPLRISRTFEVEAFAFPAIKDVRIADLDGLRGPEVVYCLATAIAPAAGAAASGRIVAYNLATQTKQLDVEVPYCAALDVGQLDADPAMEILFGARSSRIIDGVTGATEWFYSSPFVQSLVKIGDFNGDGTLEFVLGDTGAAITLFSGNLPVEVGRIQNFFASELALVNIDGTPGDELLIGSTASNFIRIFNPNNLTGPTTDITDVGITPTNFAVGQFDGDPGREMWYSANVAPAGGDLLARIDLDSRSVEFRQDDSIGPVHVTAPAQLDDDAGLEVAVLSTTGNAGFRGASVFIYDAATRYLKRSFRLVRDPGSQIGIDVNAVELGQLDADAPLELVISGTGYTSFLLAVDSFGMIQWFVEQTQQTPIGFGFPRGLGVVDKNNDGIDEVFLATQTTGGLFEFNGNTGAITWQLPPSAVVNQGLTIANVDADPQPEIIVSSRVNVAPPNDDPATRIYDSVTHSLERIIMQGGVVSPLLVNNALGTKQLVWFNNEGDLDAAVLTALDLAPGEVSRSWTAPYRIRQIESRPLTDGRFFLAGNGRLSLLDWINTPPQIVQRSPFLDLEIGTGSEIRLTPPINALEERRVFVGGQGAIFEMLVPPILFADGFEGTE